MSEQTSLPNVPEYTVSEVSAALRRTVENAFDRVRVRGEVSGFKRAASGHLYMSLKDENAVIDAVCWRSAARYLSVEPEDGLEIVATGRVTTYAARSRYQIVIDSVEIAGEGALLKLLEERRRKLAAEGLFDGDRKRPPPFLPDAIGVVTSPSGAVIRDILHRLRDRFPRRVLLWPVLVQGEGAAEQVAAAVRGFNDMPVDGPVPRPDVLIVARGGGSIEDLWAFNEEIVVRAVADGDIPLISAIGHETDTTLIDFVADARAPTPTAAAEMAVPVRTDLLDSVEDLRARLRRAAHRMFRERRIRLEGLRRGLRNPGDVLQVAVQRLDDSVERLTRSWRRHREDVRRSLTEAGRRLHARHVGRLAAEARLDLRRLTRALARETSRRVAERRMRLEGLHRGLRSPGDVLQVAVQRLDDSVERLTRSWHRHHGDVRRSLTEAGRRLHARHVERLAAEARLDLRRLTKALARETSRRVAERRTRWDSLVRLLESLGYRNVLDRGYAVVRSDGGVLSRAAAVTPGAALDIEFVDGHVGAKVDGSGGTSGPRRREPAAASGQDGGQGRLL